MASNGLALVVLLVGRLISAHSHADVPVSTINATEDINFFLPQPTNHLQVYALPVGQGDCTIMQCPNGDIIVVDCGSQGGNRKFSVADVKHYLGDLSQRMVTVIITHADSDHYNYIDLIFNDEASADRVQDVYIGETVANYDADMQEWLQYYQLKNRLHTFWPCIGKLDCGEFYFCRDVNIKFNILAVNLGASSNEKSIVMKVSVGQWSMLLPGDMEGTTATFIALTLGQQTLQSTVYKMAHHGASTRANSLYWLTLIQPKSAFASNGYNYGSYRHPRCETIARINFLQTIDQLALPHHLYCGYSANTNLNPKQLNVARSIYETSPSQNKMCILIYDSSGYFNSICDPPDSPNHFMITDKVYDDESRNECSDSSSELEDLVKDTD